MTAITRIQNDLPPERLQAKSAAELSKNDFIKLFLTQLKMQSPLKPFESGEMMQQMSQLTSLSASQELEKTIKNLNGNLGKSQVLQASQLIGKKVQLLNEVSPLVPGEGLSGAVVLSSPTKDVTVTLTDKNNQVVKTIKLGDIQSNGLVDFKWDGRDEAGNPLPADYYQMTANGAINNQVTKLQTTGTFRVNSVGLNNTNDGVIVNVDGVGGVEMDQVVKIL